MKILLLVALLLAVSFSYTLDKIVTDDGKVKVQLYYQSLCPYCQQFIQRSLKVASQTKDFWKICDFNLYPYGNAKRVKNGTSWSFTCQHGPNECQGNIIQSCVLKKYDFYTQALPFIICLQADSSNWINSGKKCAQTYGLNWDSIFQCSNSQQGVNYQVQIAEKTESLVPPHTYVPWIVVNDQHTSSAENAVASNMVKYVCSIYRGPIKIDACN